MALEGQIALVAELLAATDSGCFSIHHAALWVTIQQKNVRKHVAPSCLPGTCASAGALQSGLTAMNSMTLHATVEILYIDLPSQYEGPWLVHDLSSLWLAH